MAYSDASEVDAAICAHLANDATLAGLLPNGVYYDVAMSGSQAFAIVALLDHGREDQLQEETAWETYLYLIKAVTLIPFGVAGTQSKEAAKRIHELMQHATINAIGYRDMSCKRIERIRYTEVDEISGARWQHRGGHYELWLIPEE